MKRRRIERNSLMIIQTYRERLLAEIEFDSITDAREAARSDGTFECLSHAVHQTRDGWKSLTMSLAEKAEFRRWQ